MISTRCGPLHSDRFPCAGGALSGRLNALFRPGISTIDFDHYWKFDHHFDQRSSPAQEACGALSGRLDALFRPGIIVLTIMGCLTII